MPCYIILTISLGDLIVVIRLLRTQLAHFQYDSRRMVSAACLSCIKCSTESLALLNVCWMNGMLRSGHRMFRSV